VPASPTPVSETYRERYHQDAHDSRKLLLLGSDDIEWTSSSVGLILRAPDTTRWRVGVDNNGYFTTTQVT
jgi:hypothetical protein